MIPDYGMLIVVTLRL